MLLMDLHQSQTTLTSQTLSFKPLMMMILNHLLMMNLLTLLPQLIKMKMMLLHLPQLIKTMMIPKLHLKMMMNQLQHPPENLTQMPQSAIMILMNQAA